MKLAEARDLDQSDAFATKRAQFKLPEGVVYLDGNSLGALPRGVEEAVQQLVTNQWGKSLIRGWNEHDWIDLPEKVASKLAPLLGTKAHCISCGDSTSLNVFKTLAAALSLRPARKIILSDTGNFPTDLYMAQGLSQLLAQGHELKTVAPEDVAEAIDESVAVLMLTQVDYRSGKLHPMAELTQKAQAVGALTLWDLAHSAGAFQVELDACNADFAVGCGYKYLNGGPGAPAFCYVAERHHKALASPLSGWMGHAAPFAFDHEYQPAEGVRRLRVGTPPILGLTALNRALDVYDGVDMQELRKKALALCDLFIEEVQTRCPQVELVGSKNRSAYGSQVSFRHESGYAIVQALIAEGVIGDFRAPNVMRFGFTPLYIGYEDTVKAAQTLQQVLEEELWRQPEYMTKAKVT
ncbi:kynureninase [Polycladidibacter hongkongensis]|uniref:kynureninase n=1 Tax=Polycladidibacter hongkongensis TaxID=1647556 RepID=UPI000833B6F9|nr:kynureninase [Pseudovibrio hongkongensis]